MANISFYLNYNKRDVNNYVPIFIRFSDKGSDFRFSTGEKILSPIKDKDKYWNGAKYRVLSKHDDWEDINDGLAGLEARILKIYRDEKLKGKIPTVQKVKSLLVSSLDSQKEKNDFFSLYDQYIEVNTGVKTNGTIKNYKNSLYYIKEFVKDTKSIVEFDAIDFTFNEKFFSYLVNGEKVTNNTIGRIYKNLKSFLNWATDKGLNTNLAFKKFKAKKEEKEVIYLTYIELNRLNIVELDDEFYEQILDVFCLGCFTSLRISDLKTITKDNIKSGSIHVRIQKTKDILQIPLLPEALSILKRYKYNMPSFYDQQINKHIKEICEWVGINEVVYDIKYRGAKRIETKHLKHELITTHVARKTFVTLCLEKGMPVQNVMAITGHKDYKTMKPYIKVADKTKSESLLNAWK